jgi:hypothetical protein
MFASIMIGGAERRRHGLNENVAIGDVGLSYHAFSISSRASQQPPVAATAAWAGFRPVANAFGGGSIK